MSYPVHNALEKYHSVIDDGVALSAYVTPDADEPGTAPVPYQL